MKKMLVFLSIFIIISCEKEPEIPACEINKTGEREINNKSNFNILVDIVYEDCVIYTEPDQYGISYPIKIGENDERTLKPGEYTTYTLLANVKIYVCLKNLDIYNQWVISGVRPVEICEYNVFTIIN